VLAAPIVREADGLARSSRNQYLDPDERALAPELHRSLLAMREALLAGRPWREVEAAACARLAATGFQVDYAVVRSPLLAEPGGRGDAGERVALVAARIGRTRLIDNLEFSVAP
jgi:pantoate--beta-alanine ligase